MPGRLYEDILFHVKVIRAIFFSPHDDALL